MFYLVLLYHAKGDNVKVAGRFCCKRNGNVLAARSLEDCRISRSDTVFCGFYYTTVFDGLQGFFFLFSTGSRCSGKKGSRYLKKVADISPRATKSATKSATRFWLYIAIIFIIFIKVAQVADILRYIHTGARTRVL